MRVRVATAVFLSCLTALAVSAQTTTDCPAFIDSSSITSPTIDDFTEHTYAVPASGTGTFADCTVTRQFAKPITSFKLFIVSGRADDIGFVGSKLVTDIKTACRDIGTVQGRTDVTDQVTISGNSATFSLRAQENCCCSTGWGSATEAGRPNARFEWQVSFGEVDQQVTVGLAGGAVETTPASDSMKTAHIPLGGTFTVQLLKKDQNGLPQPVVATFTLASQDVEPAITGRTLFAGRTAIPFGGVAAASTKSFQATHLGTATITITPADTTQKPVALPISIEAPAALGATHTEFDTNLTTVAHEAGVPPQMLKGQVQKESDFVARAYRYEPLSVDLDAMSANGRNLRTVAPYSNFRLATADRLTQGSQLIDDDITPRDRYSIVRNNVRRAITSTDTLVSCREIYEQNDAAIGWRATSSQSRLRRIEADPTLLDFTAQTPLAASYGWFQVLYSTAIAQNWAGINGQQNPSFLFDTVENLASGGGSIRVAMVRLRGGFNAENQGQSASPDFADRTAFDSAWQRGFNNYNHNNGAEARQPYGVRILQFAHNYEPRPSGAIFR
jgi:hypothetical protein